MPNTKSAKKALRVSLRKRDINLEKTRKIRIAKRAFNKSIAAEKLDKKEIIENLSSYFSSLDKAAKSNFIHKNKASRLKARATKKVNQLPL
jgi:small subunit ribosomal protein S20